MRGISYADDSPTEPTGFISFDALFSDGGHMTRLLGATGVAGMLLVATIATGRAQAPKGDLWETTSQMSMEGVPMRMPANTAKVC